MNRPAIIGWCAAVLPMAFAPLLAVAQNWAPVGVPGTVLHIRSMATNADGNALYFGGTIPMEGDWSNWWLTNSVVRYTGDQWDTLGVLNGDVRAVIVHNDTLFAGGHFWEVSGQPCGGIVFHDGTQWVPAGNLQSKVSRLRSIDGVLYATGSFQMADGVPAPGVARWTGQQWMGVGQIDHSGTSIHVVDIAGYDGTLVMVSPVAVDGIRGFFQLQGDDWLPLGPGIQGGLSGAGCLMVYQGDLYVSGQFSPLQGNAGKDIMRWDGDSFHGLGAGLQATLGDDATICTGQVMRVHDGLLWVGGGFYYAGGVPANGLATWDGSRWCGVPGDFIGSGSGIMDMAFYQDTLFTALSGTSVDGIDVQGAAKFIGSSYMDECGAAIGVDEVALPDIGLCLFPNPTWGPLHIRVENDGPHVLRVLDIAGRTVRVMFRSSVARMYMLDLSHLAIGTYSVEVTDGRGKRNLRMVVRE